MVFFPVLLHPTFVLCTASITSVHCLLARRSLSLGSRQPKGTQRRHRRRQREGAQVSLVVRQRAVGVQLPGDKRRSAQRAGALPVLQPPVDAVPVEDVAAVSHPPDLVGALELVEAHRAALRQAAMAALRGDQLLEPDRRRALLDQLGRERAKARLVVMGVGVRVMPLGFGLQQGAEAEAVEDPVDEPSQVGEEEEQVEEELRELRVANREPHVGIEEPEEPMSCGSQCRSSKEVEESRDGTLQLTKDVGGAERLQCATHLPLFSLSVAVWEKLVDWPFYTERRRRWWRRREGVGAVPSPSPSPSP
ncbi:unnamed protein product, partial [Musa acuminata var. zebrina]